MKKLVNLQFAKKSLASFAAGLAALASFGIGAHAGEIVYVEDVEVEEPSSWFNEWWNGPGLTGNWFGARDTLEDYGLEFSGGYQGIFYGLLSGGREPERSWYDQQVRFRLNVDFEKLVGIPGLSIFTEIRYRQGDTGFNGRNINDYVGATGGFGPSHFQSGTQWRWTRLEAKLKLLDGKVTLLGGRTSPYNHFAKSKLRKKFVNNVLESSEGIGSNIPWSSSYVAWGGHIQIRPIDPAYLQFGIYQANRDFTSTGNHGLAWGGYGDDGVWYMAEVGFETDKLDNPDILPGQWRAGGYYFGTRQRSSFLGDYTYPGQYGFYAQYDQMLYREPSPAPAVKTVYDKATGKKTVIEEPSKPSKQGLWSFSFFEFAPKYDNLLPFYFHTGLMYEGLIPGRDKDQFLTAFAFGRYSYYKLLDDRNNGRPEQTYSAVWEIGYRIHVNEWAYLQPYSQYIINPNGANTIANAWVIGFWFGVDF